MKVLSAIACNLDAPVLRTALPLLQEGRVEAVEWSFDTLYQHRVLPEWFSELLQAFAKEKRLIGHGVYFSLFSGKWSEQQAAWLDQLRKLSTTFQFDHITEHFGFMTGEDFHKGAPISIPFNAATLALGRDRLQRIADAAQCPLGLENLAFAYSLEAVKEHGFFLEQLLEPINGFIILDLHNLYCQLQNFDVSFEKLLTCYPLSRVREIHISGGSWEDSEIRPGRKIRRDTHDGAVPAEVFFLLEKAIGQCPNLKFVVLEQMGTALVTEKSQQQFRSDFFKMDEIIQRKNSLVDASNLPREQNAFFSQLPKPLSPPLEFEELYAQQMELSTILETATNYAQAVSLLQHSRLAHSDWGVEAWEPTMLETSLAIAQKWKNGFK